MDGMNEVLEQEKTPLKVAYIPISHPDIRRIRKGKCLEFHFHGSNCTNGKITFFVGQRESIPQIYSNQGLDAREKGDVCPIVLELHQLDHLEVSTDALYRTIDTNPKIQVFVVSSRTLNRLNKDLKKSS